MWSQEPFTIGWWICWMNSASKMDHQNNQKWEVASTSNFSWKVWTSTIPWQESKLRCCWRLCNMAKKLRNKQVGGYLVEMCPLDLLISGWGICCCFLYSASKMHGSEQPGGGSSNFQMKDFMEGLNIYSFMTSEQTQSADEDSIIWSKNSKTSKWETLLSPVSRMNCQTQLDVRMEERSWRRSESCKVWTSIVRSVSSWRNSVSLFWHQGLCWQIHSNITQKRFYAA